VSPLSSPQKNWAHRTQNEQRGILTAFVNFVFCLPLEEAYVYLQEIGLFEIFYKLHLTIYIKLKLMLYFGVVVDATG
jgi:hypothetical protein